MDIQSWGKCISSGTGYMEGRQCLGAALGLDQVRLSPLLTSWIRMDGQRVAPGTQSSGILGMWFWAQIKEGSLPPRARE